MSEYLGARVERPGLFIAPDWFWRATTCCALAIAWGDFGTARTLPSAVAAAAKLRLMMGVTTVACGLEAGSAVYGAGND